MARPATLATLAAAVVWFAVAGPAASQDIPPECADPDQQQVTNMCLGYRVQALKSEVDTLYAEVVVNETEMRAGNPVELKKALEALTAGQSAFAIYSENQCRSEGYMAMGGSLEPQLHGECTLRLLTARLAELKTLKEGLGN